MRVEAAAELPQDVCLRVGDLHGLRRGNEDNRKAIMTLLRDEEWVKWSNRDIPADAA